VLSCRQICVLLQLLHLRGSIKRPLRPAAPYPVMPSRDYWRSAVCTLQLHGVPAIHILSRHCDRSVQEREQEYLRARARIMGSNGGGFEDGNGHPVLSSGECGPSVSALTDVLAACRMSASVRTCAFSSVELHGAGSLELVAMLLSADRVQ